MEASVETPLEIMEHLGELACDETKPHYVKAALHNAILAIGVGRMQDLRDQMASLARQNL